MTDDTKILQFPDRMRDAIDEEAWRSLQSEFYLDCYFSQHGEPPEDPDALRAWLTEAKVFADMDNPFFRGWLVRRLLER